MEKQRNALVEAYCRKGCALCRLCYLESGTEGSDVGDSKVSNQQLQAINNIWKEVMKFSEPTDLKVRVVFHLFGERSR